MPQRIAEEAPKKEVVKSTPEKRAVAPKPTTDKQLTFNESESKVSYEISITKKIGDFEFMKLTAGVEVPVGATEDLMKLVDETLVIVRDRVIVRLEKDLESIAL